jgi:ATP-dependent Clp protease ATP-binding subunit ClpC
LKHPKRPIGSFLFLGPSGVGKTELSRTLATHMFGSERAMIRLDMSEYMEKHSVSRLIGSPPGYVGYEEGGQLTEQVRRRPYSVLLFDEIEKAHPDIFNLLLQVLDDGILTDSQGRRVDFSNTVIIMTSNLGTDTSADHRILGFSDGGEDSEQTQLQHRMLSAVRERFRPEFLNRVDELIFFHRLSKETLTKIAVNLLEELTRRAGELGLTLRFDDTLPRFLVEQSTDTDQGARPLRRTVIRLIEDPLALALLENRIQKGQTVLLSPRDGMGEITIETLHQKEALPHA